MRSTAVSDLVSWSSDWTDLKVAVLGIDPVAFAVVDTLVELGARPRVVADDAGEYARLLTVLGVELRSDAGDAELLIATAATPDDHPALTTGVPVWGDVEFAWRVRDKVRAADWLCVTGQSDTALLVDLAVHLVGSAGSRAAGVGHGNVPILDAVREPAGFDLLVVELTERELRWAASSPVSPFASLCLDGAAPALGGVYANTRVACIYNKAEESTMQFVEEAEVVDGCRAVGFDLGVPGPSDLGLVGDIVVDRAFHEERHSSALELTTRGELAAAGLGDAASVSRVLAASALVRSWGLAPDLVNSGIASFGDTRRS